MQPRNNEGDFLGKVSKIIWGFAPNICSPPKAPLKIPTQVPLPNPSFFLIKPLKDLMRFSKGLKRPLKSLQPLKGFLNTFKGLLRPLNCLLGPLSDL